MKPRLSEPKKLLVRWSDVQDDFQFKSIRKEREYSEKNKKVESSFKYQTKLCAFIYGSSPNFSFYIKRIY